MEALDDEKQNNSDFYISTSVYQILLYSSPKDLGLKAMNTKPDMAWYRTYPFRLIIICTFSVINVRPVWLPYYWSPT